MLKEKDLKMLSHFRNDSRMSLTKMSKMTQIPVSTIFDRLKELERRKVINRHTALLDFKKLGYDIRIQILINAGKEKKKLVQDFLIKNKKVNNVLRVNNGYDFLAEVIFKSISEFDEFLRQLEGFGPMMKKEFFVMEDLKREGFFTYANNVGISK